MRQTQTTLLCLLLLIIATTSVTATNQWIATSIQAEQAYDYAMEYVTNEVAYLYGGRLQVDQYLQELEAGKQPGIDIGVDASALVVNAYRDNIPSLKFWYDENQTRIVSDATSSILANYNSQTISKDNLIPGDLIFFQNSNGVINGVAIFSHIQGEVIHFITASANAGKVVLTNALLQGDYWNNSFARFGRLLYVTDQ